MATDYDAPRKTDEELAEDSLEDLKAQQAEKASSPVDVDEAELAESIELPGSGPFRGEFDSGGCAQTEQTSSHACHVSWSDIAVSSTTRAKLDRCARIVLKPFSPGT